MMNSSPTATYKKKFAVGLFHFNVQYISGDLAVAHRYCIEAVIPFLRYVSKHPWFTPTFELCGSGLEFLNKHYPFIIDELRHLVHSNRIELISSTYAPTIWIAFPQADLLRSIDINLRCLHRLRLPASPIFFSQEAFFGMGLTCISRNFRYALCKDDYVLYQRKLACASSCYSLNDIQVIVGSNHIVNEMARNSLEGIDVRNRFISPSHSKRISTGLSNLPYSDERFHNGSNDDIEWIWYHMGSGHHLTCSEGPNNMNSFFHDQEWELLVTDLLTSYLHKGYSFSSLSHFAAQFSPVDSPQLPFLVEGSWNSRSSKGVYAWMGRQETSWDDSPAVLGRAWRSRSKLIECGRSIAAIRKDLREDLSIKLDDIWTSQILAESSDPLGWKPHPCEVNYGKAFSDDVIRRASVLKNLIDHQKLSEDVTEQFSKLQVKEKLAQNPVPVTAVGCEHSLCWGKCSLDNTYLLDALVVPTGGKFGLSFPRYSDQIIYSQSGQEHSSVEFDVNDLLPDPIYLPLSNGLIGIGQDTYVIRVNSFVQSAAKIPKAEKSVCFVWDSGPISRKYSLRFYLFFGDRKNAVRLANIVNDTDLLVQ